MRLAVYLAIMFSAVCIAPLLWMMIKDAFAAHLRTRKLLAWMKRVGMSRRVRRQCYWIMLWQLMTSFGATVHADGLGEI